ncbi:MAG TPA: hypothetical protein VJ777_29295 [Mycobacterium sp.]|nr:hypothetical protein [Mycobacterium sp.]
MADLVRRVDAGLLWLIDGMVLLWVLLCLGLGAWVASALWEIASIAGIAIDTGRMLDDAGQLLQRAGDIPIIGDLARGLGDDVRDTAAELIDRGRRSAELWRQVSVLVGVVLALAALAPVLGSYLPARISRSREVRMILRLLGGPHDSEVLDRYLAQRAVLMIRFDRLPGVMAGNPGEPNVPDDRQRALADAELGRLGVRRGTGRASGAPV